MMAITNFNRSMIVMDGQAAVGVGKAIEVGTYDNVNLTITSLNGGDFTVKIMQGATHERPDFSNPVRNKDNMREHIGCYKYLDGSFVSGTDGVTFSGDDVVTLKVNCDEIIWLNVECTSYNAGDIYVYANPSKRG